MRFVVAVSCIALVAACRKTPVEQLSDADPRVRVAAVETLRQQKDRAAAPLIARLLKDPLVKDEAALALGELGGAGEVQALLDAVDTTVGAGSDAATRQANRTNAHIAEAVGAIVANEPGASAQAGKAAPVLLRLARAQDDAVRLAAVQALGEVRARDAVPELMHLVDDGAAPPLLVKKAIVALGVIGDPAAIPALLHALVIERQGVSFVPESSFALYLLGDQAVDPLVRVLRDEDAAHLAWTREHDRPQAGSYARAALVLGDLEDVRAVPALLPKLKYADPDPGPGTARLLSNDVRRSAALALGKLRVAEAAAPIQALATTREGDEDVAEGAADALVWIGDRAQAKELVRKADAGAVRARLALAERAALLGEPGLQGAVEALAAKAGRESPQVCTRQLAELQVDGQGCEAVRARFKAAAAPLEAAKQCGADAACWTARLADADARVRARAALELGRAGAATPGAIDGLVKQSRSAGDDALVAREAAIRALDWLAAVPAARAALKAHAAGLADGLPPAQGNARLEQVDEDLRRLQVKLSRL